MTTIMRMGGWAAVIVAALVTLVWGPFVAGFVFVAIAFATILVLMLGEVFHAIGDWRLEHPWRLHWPRRRRA